MYISDNDKDRILSVCDDKIVDTISAFGPLKKSGASFTASCPSCGAENGLSINPAKKVFKCFKCGNCQGKSSVAYLMHGHNMDYPTALKWLADHYNIIISEPERPVRNGSNLQIIVVYDYIIATSFIHPTILAHCARNEGGLFENGMFLVPGDNTGSDVSGCQATFSEHTATEAFPFFLEV